MIKAAGILILDKDNKALFLKRGPGSDYPGLWAFPGGRLEDDESPMHAAIRETKEEADFTVKPADLRPWTRSIRPGMGENPEEVDFTTYLLRGAEQFIPVLGPAGSPEHVAYAWAPIAEPPEPMHPGAALALQRFNMHETDVANAMAAGLLVSPQTVDNMTLFNIRITGTGTSYRTAHNEHVWRDPSLYLTDEFVQRCNGLPVIFEHPKGSVLNSKEFTDRIVGTIVKPYIKPGTDEVWGIARMYDAGVIKLMSDDQMSTSPAVVWRDPDVNQKFTQDDGSTFLIEGKPSLLDHIAICERGVWDKGGGPTGVESVTVKSDNQPLARGDSEMAIKLTRIKDESDDAYKARCDEMQKLIDGARADAAEEGDKTKKALDAVTAALDAANARMDAIEEEKKADKAKADAEEEKEKEEKKADARKRADAFKFSKRKDGEDEDEFKARRDAEEKACADAEMEAGEPEPMAVDKAKKRRADAEKEEEEEVKKADAARGDSEVIAKMREEIDALKARSITRTDDEQDQFAAAQARADEVYSAFSKSAPRPMDGESLLGYRRRLLNGIKEHSSYKDAELGVAAADSAMFGIVEAEIYKQAGAIARSPASVPAGELREVVRTRNGHTYTEFVGDPASWLSNHSPNGQAVTAFGTTAKK